MKVPAAEDTGCWIGVDLRQNVPVVAATPAGPVVFWKAARIRHGRRVYAERRRKLQKAGKYRALKRLESRDRWIRHPRQPLHHQGFDDVGETPERGIDGRPFRDPGSRLGSVCDWKHETLRLKDRAWIYPECGTHHDRNPNAALNLKRLATGTALPGIVLWQWLGQEVCAAVGKPMPVRDEWGKPHPAAQEENPGHDGAGS